MERNTSEDSPHIEMAILHEFIAKLIQCMWERNKALPEIVSSEIDNQGHDVVISCGNITRHIQLKASKHQGSRTDLDIDVGFCKESSGCLVRVFYDPIKLEMQEFRFFGSEAGSLPPSTDAHPGAKSPLIKKPRKNVRNISRGRYKRVKSIDEVAILLFGKNP